MGAAFNYKLFVAEPGAYAHNPEYAKQLIIDSIDAAYNGGTVTGSIDSALADLFSRNLINGDQIASLTTASGSVDGGVPMPFEAISFTTVGPGGLAPVPATDGEFA